MAVRSSLTSLRALDLFIPPTAISRDAALPPTSPLLPDDSELDVEMSTDQATCVNCLSVCLSCLPCGVAKQAADV